MPRTDLMSGFSQCALDGGFDPVDGGMYAVRKLGMGCEVAVFTVDARIIAQQTLL